MVYKGGASDDRSGISVSMTEGSKTVIIVADYNNGNGFQSGHVRVYKLG